jgi:hypothetical protein
VIAHFTVSVASCMATGITCNETPPRRQSKRVADKEIRPLHMLPNYRTHQRHHCSSVEMQLLPGKTCGISACTAQIRLIHIYHAVSLPCRVLRESQRVAGKIRTANRETPRRTPLKPNLGRSPWP